MINILKSKTREKQINKQFKIHLIFNLHMKNLIKKITAFRLWLIASFAFMVIGVKNVFTTVHYKTALRFFKPLKWQHFGDMYNLSGHELSSMNRAAFNSFDDFDGQNFDPNLFSNSYDPDNATGKPNPGQPRPQLSGLAQFTIKIVNALGADTKIELFNFLRSVAFAANSDVSALNPWTAVSVAAANANSLIYFDQSGNLIFQDAGGLKLTISCNQVPYISLFYASAFFPMRVERMLMTFTLDSSLDQDIKHTTNTFLGGKKTNPITPRTFFDPTQFQSKLVNIKAPYDIDIEKGLQFTILSTETLSFNLYLRRYVKPTL